MNFGMSGPYSYDMPSAIADTIIPPSAANKELKG